MSLCTPLCCFFDIMHLFSEYLSIILQCGGPLLNIIFSFSSPRCMRWPDFALIRVSYHCVIDVMLLDCVCGARLIRTRIVYSVSSHMLLPEFDTQADAAAQLLEFKVSKCITSQFARCFLPVKVRRWDDLPHTVFGTGTLNGY